MLTMWHEKEWSRESIKWVNNPGLNSKRGGRVRCLQPKELSLRDMVVGSCVTCWLEHSWTYQTNMNWWCGRSDWYSRSKSCPFGKTFMEAGSINWITLNNSHWAQDFIINWFVSLLFELWSCRVAIGLFIKCISILCILSAKGMEYSLETCTTVPTKATSGFRTDPLNVSWSWIDILCHLLK